MEGGKVKWELWWEQGMIRDRAEKANIGYGIALKHNRRVEWSVGEEEMKDKGKMEKRRSSAHCYCSSFWW